MNLTFDTYWDGVTAAKFNYPSWRAGQAAFNVLYEMRPDLSGQIRAAALDPFHDDSKLPAFYAWVKEHWDA